MGSIAPRGGREKHIAEKGSSEGGGGRVGGLLLSPQGPPLLGFCEQPRKPTAGSSVGRPRRRAKASTRPEGLIRPGSGQGSKPPRRANLAGRTSYWHARKNVTPLGISASLLPCRCCKAQEP